MTQYFSYKNLTKIIIILSLFLVENYSRGGAKYHENTNAGFRKIPKIELKGKKSLYPIIFCTIIFLLSFIPFDENLQS